MQETNFERLAQSMQSQELCSCGRDERVIFVCQFAKCEYKDKQPLYCMKCYNDEPSNHDHKGDFIVAKGDKFKRDWRQTREDIQNTASKVKDLWANQGPLVEILATQNRKVIDDYQKLCELESSAT